MMTLLHHDEPNSDCKSADAATNLQQISSKTYLVVWDLRSCYYGIQPWLLNFVNGTTGIVINLFISQQEHQNYQILLSLSSRTTRSLLSLTVQKIPSGYLVRRVLQNSREQMVQRILECSFLFHLHGNLESSGDDLFRKSVDTLPKHRKTSRAHLCQLVASDRME